MGKHFFDFEDGDFAFSISDNMAMDSDGDLMMRMGNNMAMDMDTGDIHMISSWPNDDDESERTMKPPYYCGHRKNTEAFYGIQRHNRKERNELLYFRSAYRA